MTNIELKEKVKQYIENKVGNFYPSDISEELDTDFSDIMDICNELIDEGIIDVEGEKEEYIKILNTFNEIGLTSQEWSEKFKKILDDHVYCDDNQLKESSKRYKRELMEFCMSINISRMV